MPKIILITIILEVLMSIAHAKDLPDFDKLWNFNNSGETETKFRALLPEAKSSGDKDYYLQLLTQIARAQGLQRKFEEAHKTLDKAEAGLNHETQKAEVRYLLERGRVFNSSKRPKEGLPLFIKAFELSVSHKMDHLAVDSAHMVAIAEAGPQRQQEWNLKAMAIAEKSKDQRARDWLGPLYNNMGWTYHDSGQLEEALNMFKKSLAFREAKGEAQAVRIAKWSVARTYRSMKRYQEALAIQVELEKEFERAGEKDGYVFEELGELYLLNSKTELSKKYFTLAYQELSKDEWFKANEGKRLQRIKELKSILEN